MKTFQQFVEVQGDPVSVHKMEAYSTQKYLNQFVSWMERSQHAEDPRFRRVMELSRQAAKEADAIYARSRMDARFSGVDPD